MKNAGRWLALPFIYLWKGLLWIPKGIWWCLKEMWYFVFPRFILHVSYDQTWGNSDDQSFKVKRFIIKKKDFLKFKTIEGDIVEIRGSKGLNYRIEEV
tara:strand:- start:52 stop:345 length:294 start_codon:yes stop_codon:yes gene_type:complete